MNNKTFKAIRVDCDNRNIYELLIENSVESFKMELKTDSLELKYLPTGDVVYINSKHPSFENDMNKADIFGDCIIANNCEKDVEIEIERIKSLVPKSYLLNCKN